MLLKILITLLFCSIVTASGTTYEGYKIYDVLARNNIQKLALHSLSDSDKYDFFILPKKITTPARVMVEPQYQNEFEKALRKYGLKYNIINDNVGASVQLEYTKNILRSASATPRIGFTSFHRFDKINDYLDGLASIYQKRVSVRTVGRSYEGREIKTITITNGDGVQNKSVIFVDGGIHAREWIAPAGALYVINQLVENFTAHGHLLKNYDWIVLPVVNPDGYEYTHTNSRFWRKTRKPSGLCYGADANRNFGFHFGETGASAFSCSEVFKGPYAFSEPESGIVRDIMHSLAGRGKMYLTLHSFGRYLMYPWGFTSDVPINWKDIHNVCQAGADAIKQSTGFNYTVGSSTNVMYAAAGGSDDYALGVAKIPISITMELPGGGSGFDPPQADIQPFVKETWTGIEAMAMKVMELY